MNQAGGEIIEQEESEEMKQDEVREPRTFAQNVERVNIGFLVSMSPKVVEQFAKDVDALLEAAAGRLIFVKGPTADRLFIEKARPRFDRDDRRGGDRRDRRDDRPREDRQRRQFSFGGRQ